MYLERNIQQIAKKYLTFFPVIAIIGPRQAGKTTFVKKLCPTWKYFDLEDPADYNLLDRDIGVFFDQYHQNIIIDEAQELPKLFNVIRGVIDEKREKRGRFILTGSSSPELISHISDSLSGRIGIINLGTLKANEIYEKPLSEFYQIFKEPIDKNLSLPACQLSNEQVRAAWFSGGYPELVANPDPEFRQHWMKNYQDTYINRDIAKLFPRLNNRAYQRFIDCLSGLSGTILNKSEIARTIDVSEGAIREYLQIAETTFIWRNINYFSRNSLKSIVKKSKGYMRDTGLLHHLQMIPNIDQLLKRHNAGNSFEGFVIEEIILGLEAAGIANTKYNYYRTKNGIEIDLILEGDFGMIPIEIKMGSIVEDKHLKSLHQFIDEHKLPCGLLINQGKDLRWVSKTVIQIPIGCL